MKMSIVWIVSLIVFPVILHAQSKKGYEINGKLEGVKDGEVVKMLPYHNGLYGNGDSVYIKNGTFNITGHVLDGPLNYELVVKDSLGYVNHVRMNIDNGEQITIRGGDISKFRSIWIDQFLTIEGSKSNYAREILMPAFLVYNQNINLLNNYLEKIRDSIGFDRSLVDGILTAKRVVGLNLFLVCKAYGDPTYKPAFSYFMYLLSLNNIHDSFMSDWYNDLLDEKAQKGFYGKLMKQWIQLCIGHPFPPFNLPTPEGKMVSLKDVVGKNKLTLVHFWASNSDRRKELEDDLLIKYKKYHHMGFDIIGLCSDFRESLYKAAINEAQFPWSNVSDLKGQDGITENVYHEFNRTTNVLIDAAGNIVAWNVKGAEFQWYLWKFFENK